MSISLHILHSSVYQVGRLLTIFFFKVAFKPAYGRPALAIRPNLKIVTDRQTPTPSIIFLKINEQKFKRVFVKNVLALPLLLQYEICFH